MAKKDITGDFTDSNFKSFVFNNYCKKDGVGKDGEERIYDDDVKAVTSLDVSGKGKDRYIESLDGIEHFAALRDLNCSGNNLQALNVEHNVELKALYCANNRLTKLNVSGNPSLMRLECSYNRLTDLDTENNGALLSLHCQYNGLTALNVSKNPALMELCCCSNRLTGLDVSNNHWLILLDCSGNPLTPAEIKCNTIPSFCYYDENRLILIDRMKYFFMCKQLADTDLNCCKSFVNTYITGIPNVNNVFGGIGSSYPPQGMINPWFGGTNVPYMRFDPSFGMGNFPNFSQCNP